MDLQLTPELIAFRDAVRDYLRDQLTPELRRGQQLTSAMYPEPEISGPWQARLRERGWLVPLWPREWGGTGWSAIERFIFETECALAGAPLVHPMGVRLVGPVILQYGTDAQKALYLPRILSGDDYWCQGFSESGAGSDLASLRTRAVRDGDDYVVNGSKLWTTHAHHANRMFALVRTSNAGRRQEGISFLLIDMASPGVSVRPVPTIGGDHDVNEVFFDNVRVPVTDRIGAENQGWECARYLLEFERGAGIFSPRLRAQLKRIGDVLASLPQCESDLTVPSLRALRFGEVSADLDAFEMLELKTMCSVPPGERPGPVASILKLRASRLRQAISEMGLSLMGAECLRWRAAGELDDADHRVTQDDALRDCLLPDFLNARAYTIFGGAAEIQLGIIAKSCLGI
ncbi:acyl-CoA dehydrogenase family protein [Cupriavidus pauculus]|uniref:Acyl-CoA dehydrogenase n=1 Tax=Cupriavidus pauculus TaxID=82633 RepID=A0A2N5C8D6_9BURK|nr:acyl-CoA dehydrogenase family protein [Cupriavidus pauculus]PLP98461.1 acyl-CoA dehydrogenase [Cupriavidus pauculus]